MTPSEVIRAAIKVLEVEGGWCQGSNAVAADGSPLLLFSIEAGDGRSCVNPRATSFSIYGAITKVLSGNGCIHTGLMWDTLKRLADQPALVAAEPHHSHIHPLILWNEHIDRTKEEVLAFMENAANELDGSDPRLPPPPLELAAYGDQERKELPSDPKHMVDGRLDLPQSVEVRGGITVEGRYMPAIGDADGVAAGAGVVGQIGFPVKQQPAAAEDERLPPIDWS